MSKLSENLNDILDVEQPKKEIVVTKPKEPEPIANSDVDADYEYSRKKFKSLIEQGESALEHLLEIAKEGEHPRAFEVASNLIKTLSDSTKELMDLQKKLKDIKGEKAIEKTGDVNIDKAVFVGSTNELLKKIKEVKSE